MSDGYIFNVFKVLLIDTSTDETIAFTKLQDAQIQRQVQQQEIRGGEGNKLLCVLDNDPSVNLQLTNPQFSYQWLSKQLGTTITTGAGTGWAMPKDYTTTDGGTSNPTITLDQTPTSTPHLSIYDSTGKQITGFTVTGSDVDFTSATPTVAVGDVVTVNTYEFATDPSTQTIEFDDSKINSGMKVVLETLEFGADKKPKNTIQYIYDNCIPEGNFTLNTQAQRNAVTTQMNLRVVQPDSSSVVGRVNRIPYVTV